MEAETASSRSWMVPVFALFVASFAVGTAELIVAGLLPAVATDFAIDIPTAGTLIAVYAFGVAIGGPLLAVPTGRLRRRALLFAVMSIFIVGNVLCAVSTGYWMLLSARLVVAAAHGLFFGIANILATQLAPKDRQSTAVSMVIAGITAAALVGLPLGTAIGNLYSWRATFWLIALMGIAATAVLVVLIPSTLKETGPQANLRAELRAVSRPSVLICYLLIVLFITADLTVYAYIVPLLTDVTMVPIATVPWLLFLAGIAGIVGNLVGGRLGDWNPVATMIGIFVLLIGVYFALSLAMATPMAMLTVCVIWWLVGFAFPAPIQARILRDASDAPNLASTLISTAFNVGIGGGAIIGGYALEADWGYERLPWISMSFAAVGLLIALYLVAGDRRVASLP